MKVLTRNCEDCGEEIPVNQGRFRCARCLKLVCAWCRGHVHYTKSELASTDHDRTR